MNSGKIMITTASILGLSFVIATAINPKMASLEAFALIPIAAYMAGIYFELKHFNNKPKDEAELKVAGTN